MNFIEHVIDYCKQHKVKTVLITVFLLLAPLLIVHVLFLFESENKIFVAKWTAGDLITYISGFEAFLGTVTLGVLTVWQANKANQMSDEATSISKTMLQLESAQHRPCLDFRGGLKQDNTSFLELIFCNSNATLRVFLKNIGPGIAKKSAIVNTELVVADKYYEKNPSLYFVQDMSKYPHELYDLRYSPVGSELHFQIYLKPASSNQFNKYDKIIEESRAGKLGKSNSGSNKVIAMLILHIELVDDIGKIYNETITCTFTGEKENYMTNSFTIEKPEFYNNYISFY